MGAEEKEKKGILDPEVRGQGSSPDYRSIEKVSARAGLHLTFSSASFMDYQLLRLHHSSVHLPAANHRGFSLKNAEPGPARDPQRLLVRRHPGHTEKGESVG